MSGIASKMPVLLHHNLSYGSELSYRALFVSSPVLPGLMSNRFLRVDWEEGGENVGKAVEWALEMCSGWALLAPSRGKVGIWRGGSTRDC